MAARGRCDPADLVERVGALIRRHSNRRISLDQAAQQAGLSAIHLHLWLSWRKGLQVAANVPNRDMLRHLLLQRTDLVDIKVCSVTDHWSGLKFVARKAARRR
ncbi:MAG: hypothetical protein ACFB22_12515 [Rhodothalassiaceae bacterium]